MKDNISKTCIALVIAASTAWLLVTIFGDLSLSISSLLLRSEPHGVIWISMVVIILGCVLPLLLSLKFVVTEARAKAHCAPRKKRRISHWTLLPAIGGSGYLLYLIERIEPVTVMPLSTTVGTLIFTVVAFWLLRQSPIQTRLTIVSICAVMILSTRFMDWNSRKPFLRDLLRLRNGMTGEQVKGIMSRHTTSEEADDDMNTSATLYYRHSDDAEYNADWGKITMRGGRVVAVHFLPD